MISASRHAVKRGNETKKGAHARFESDTLKCLHKLSLVPRPNRCISHLKCDENVNKKVPPLRPTDLLHVEWCRWYDYPKHGRCEFDHIVLAATRITVWLPEQLDVYPGTNFLCVDSVLHVLLYMRWM